MKNNRGMKVSSKMACLFGCCLISPLLLLIHGCTDDSDVTKVDFSKTQAVARFKSPPREGPYLKVAVAAMISPKETFSYYRRLLDYIGQNLGRKVQLIQRKTYGEVNELLAKGKIDLAFICSGAYVVGKDKEGFELLATPRVRGSHLYRAYLIVNKKSPFHGLKDLRGRVFAFTDPDSNTGKLVPTYWLAQMGTHPETFFRKTIYTYSHDNSILAVARALVDGSSVDGLIWEYYNHINSALTTKTRVIRKSGPYGNPPLVASKYLSLKEKGRIRDLLFLMHMDSEGHKILKELMIDRFIEPREQWYEPICKMKTALSMLEKEPYASEKP